MKVIKTLDTIPNLKGAAVTSGNFDGVHLGHLKILEKLNAIAKTNHVPSVLLTFWPHPKLVVKKKSNIKLLCLLQEKINLLAKTGLDYLVIIPFDKKVSELSPSQYVKNILIDKLNTKYFIIGYDHKFGKDRKGDFYFLKKNESKLDLKVEEISKQEIDAIAISSSQIRKHLEKGEIKEARKYLGRNYELSGEVVPGDKIGRTIGFKTANISCEKNYKLIPKNGVYAVKIKGPFGTKNGMLNIGTRPTLAGKETRIEVNIFAFDEDIYGKTLTIEFLTYIREEEKFSSTKELKSQIQKDQKTILNYLSNERI